MKISSNHPSSQANVYAQYRAAMEQAALARGRRATENGASESHVGSQLSLKVVSSTEATQEVSGLVVHETRATPVSPGSVAVLDSTSGKIIYQAPRPLGLV